MGQKGIIRLVGVLIGVFAASHLFLNLYIVIMPLFMPAEEVERVMQALSRTFGPIAIQADRNAIILAIKVTVSALFLTSAVGVIKLKEWARRLLFTLLGLRFAYGCLICAIKGFHPHIVIIFIVTLFLFYFFTRPAVKEVFA